MPAEQCANERMGRQVAEGLRVRDAMLTAPEALRADARVGDVRPAFVNPQVLRVLLVDGRVFAGAIDRGGRVRRGTRRAAARARAAAP